MTMNLIDKAKKLQAKALKRSQEKKVEAKIFGEVESDVHDVVNEMPDRHAKADIFTYSMLSISAKNDVHSMEHPMFSLATKPDTRIRYYEHNGNNIKIVPSVLGHATIWDKDILIYAVSRLMDGINRELKPSKTVRLTVYDLLVTTNRCAGGKNYQQLKSAFERLQGTSITTNIKTNGVRIHKGFGLIDSWEIVEDSEDNRRMVAIEITLSDWLYNAVLGTECITINREYFQIRGGLERRLYELARKHCGNRTDWVISIELLHKKTGSNSPLKKFRYKIKSIEEKNRLPDYFVSLIDKTGQVMFYNRSINGQKKRL